MQFKFTKFFNNFWKGHFRQLYKDILQTGIAQTWDLGYESNILS
nr:MAG TPA: hypothetical protein [Caudoviricetes sp.]